MAYTKMQKEEARSQLALEHGRSVLPTLKSICDNGKGTFGRGSVLLLTEKNSMNSGPRTDCYDREC